jgi:hypothetical protein
VRPAITTGLTEDQVTAILRDASAVETAAGLELVDLSLNVLADLTDEFAGGTVSRSNYATLHATCDLNLSTELDWGTALVRPYMTMSANGLTARFNEGVYLTSTPRTDAGEMPVTFQVAGYDILHWLNTPVGEAYSVASGTSYLTAVTSILDDQGILSYQIDPSQAGKVLPASRSWAFDDHTTWLNIINDMLAAVGYQGMWSDWDGRMQARPYVNPIDRPTEWLYDADPDAGMLAAKRASIKDWFDVPNRWTFFWSKDPSTDPPIEGNGIYTFVNQTNGPTSVSARGRTIAAKPMQVDAVDQDALIAAASISIDADLRLKTTFEASTFPNPLHWHFDKLTLADPALGPIQDVLNMSWSLPLNGSDMTHVWSLI